MRSSADHCSNHRRSVISAHRRSNLRLPQALLLLVVITAFSGCVRRRMTVRSQPPGAMVYIDDQQIGTTPVSTDFVYYGTRKIKLVKDQFETMQTYHTVAPPWYQIPPFDFITENLIGREIRDERAVDFTLVPQRIVPPQELLGRADNLRNSSQMGFAVPIPNQPPVVQPPPIVRGNEAPKPLAFLRGLREGR